MMHAWKHVALRDDDQWLGPWPAERARELQFIEEFGGQWKAAQKMQASRLQRDASRLFVRIDFPVLLAVAECCSWAACPPTSCCYARRKLAALGGPPAASALSCPEMQAGVRAAVDEATKRTRSCHTTANALSYARCEARG